MAPVSLPPGFRFHPSDEELLSYYLKRKVHGRKIELDIIPEVDLYKCEPWDLPNKSFLPNRDLEWYYFSPRDRKYPNGSRTNRATEAGYWKATGKDRKIISQLGVIGMKKTLVFYMGRAPQGKRTDWVMHEYRLDESQCEGGAGLQDAYVLCRVLKKIQKNVEEIENGSPASTNNPFSENITSMGAVKEWPKKNNSQGSQEEGSIQANCPLPSTTSSETLNDRNECTDALNCLLDFEMDEGSQNCIFRTPDNVTEDSKVNYLFEGTRCKQASVHKMLKVEDCTESLGDVKLSMPGSLSRSGQPRNIVEPFEEVDVLEEILTAAKASKHCNTHLGQSFQFDGSASTLVTGTLLENLAPSMNRISFEDTYGYQNCTPDSTRNEFQTILQNQVDDPKSTALQRELINLCRWQYKNSQAFAHLFDYSMMDGYFTIPELYSEAEILA